MDLLKLFQNMPFAPPIFSDETMDQYGGKVTLPHTTFPTRKCTKNNNSAMISPCYTVERTIYEVAMTYRWVALSAH